MCLQRIPEGYTMNTASRLHRFKHNRNSFVCSLWWWFGSCWDYVVQNSFFFHIETGPASELSLNLDFFFNPKTLDSLGGCSRVHAFPSGLPGCFRIVEVDYHWANGLGSLYALLVDDGTGQRPKLHQQIFITAWQLSLLLSISVGP